MIKYKLFEVGGAIRDRLLGIKNPKDIDYSVVIINKQEFKTPLKAFEALSFDLMKKGYEIFLETPEMFTIRGKFPKDHKLEGLVADFVIARKEGDYIKGTRQPEVSLGTLLNDLERRDFTVNCMAMDLEGNLTDPFGGQRDLQSRILRTPIDTNVSFNDDPLRILRAIRFKITKGLEFSDEMIHAFATFNGNKIGMTVSVERIRDELFKCFNYNTEQTLNILLFIKQLNPVLYSNILGIGKNQNSIMWLMPTLKSGGNNE